MELKPGLRFEPLPPIQGPVRLSPGEGSSPLGPLANLAGVWEGTGFNAIWRPTNEPGQDRFLELNVTKDSIKFDEIPGGDSKSWIFTAGYHHARSYVFSADF